MNHAEHREAGPQRTTGLASPLSDARRLAAQQVVCPEGRRRAVPCDSRERQAHGHVRRPSAGEGDRGALGRRWLPARLTSSPRPTSGTTGSSASTSPEVGPVRLGSVSHADVQTWVTTLAASQSPASVAKIHRVLSLVLDMAVKDGRLSRNVATGVNLPRVVKHEHPYLTHDQVDDLAHACGYPETPDKHAGYDSRENETYRLVVLFLAYTGVRFGEMAALRVNRLDLTRRRAAIVASVTPVQGQGLVWGTPKTHQRREVPLPGFLTAELRSFVSGRAPDDLVFPGIRSGAPLRVKSFRRAFDRAGQAIGVPGMHPHQLRHTAASLAIASGADVKVDPTDARTCLSDDDARHLRPPLRGPPRRGGKRHGRRQNSRSRTSRSTSGRCPVLPQCCPGPVRGWRAARSEKRSGGSGQHSTVHPQRDSNPCYRRERATS